MNEINTEPHRLEYHLINFEKCRNILCQLVVMLIPIFWTIASFIKNTSLTFKILIVCTAIIQIIVSLINIWNECIKKDCLDDLIRFQEIKNTHEKLQNYILQTYNYCDRARTMVVPLDFITNQISSIITQKDITIKKSKEIISTALSYALNSLNNYYNLAGEQMTIAIYYYFKETDEFLDLASAKPSILSENQNRKGRIWEASDDAHITYVARKKLTEEYVFNDINTELRKPTNWHENDSSKYVSSISVPLYNCGKKDVIGIFSLTSNYKNRFDRFDRGNPIQSYFNSIFVDIIFNIAQIVETVINFKYSKEIEQIELKKEILLDYKEHSPEYLKNYHYTMLNDLQSKMEST